jgi:hypothetical protein
MHAVTRARADPETRGGDRTIAARPIVIAEWAALAVGAALLAYLLGSPDPRIGDDDFQVFYEGAAAFARGESSYVGDFVSPPWFALALVPLTALPLGVARVAWLGLNLALLVGATAAGARLVDAGWPPRRVLLAAVLCALWPPVTFGLKLGQNSLLAWLLVLGSVLTLRADRPAASGALLALATVKPQLAFLFGAGLALRAWRLGQAARLLGAGALTLALLGVAVAVIAPNSYVDLRELRPQPWDYWGSNVGLPVLLATLLGSPERGLLAYLPLALLGTGLLLARWSDDAADLGWLGAITACATLVLTPYAYPYDAVLLELPLLWLAANAPAEWTRRRPLALACALTVLAALWLLERPGDYTAWRFLGLLPPLGLLALLVWARRAVSYSGAANADKLDARGAPRRAEEPH